MNDLQAALARADKSSSEPMGVGIGRSLTHQQLGSVASSPGTMIVERLKINRVDIKIEVSSFIERHFIARTGNDGTILELSKEQLIEGLTTLFYGLEENASKIKEEEPRRSPLRGGKNIKDDVIGDR